MEIKDKLNARYVAMQMATETMCAILTRSNGYDCKDHGTVAKNMYGFIVGDVELPEVYDPKAEADKFMDMFAKIKDSYKPKPLWLPILRDENGKPTDRVLEAMRQCLPICVHDSKRTIVIGSEEDFDRRKQEIIDNEDYTEYRPVIDSDMRFPMREPLTLGFAPK